MAVEESVVCKSRVSQKSLVDFRALQLAARPPSLLCTTENISAVSPSCASMIVWILYKFKINFFRICNNGVTLYIAKRLKPVDIQIVSGDRVTSQTRFSLVPPCFKSGTMVLPSSIWSCGVMFPVNEGAPIRLLLTIVPPD